MVGPRVRQLASLPPRHGTTRFRRKVGVIVKPMIGLAWHRVKGAAESARK